MQVLIRGFLPYSVLRYILADAIEQVIGLFLRPSSRISCRLQGLIKVCQLHFITEKLRNKMLILRYVLHQSTSLN